ncbi:hypothetical protein MspRI1_26880 [Marinobacter sp. RI1]
MGEKIEVIGATLGGFIQCLKFCFQCIGAEHGAGQRAEAAGVGNCGCQAVILNAGHRGLDDGFFYVQYVQQWMRP